MKSKHLFWGVFLLSIGIILLLNNFNKLNFTLGKFYDLWPLLLVLYGITFLKIDEIYKQIISAFSGLFASLLILSLMTSWHNLDWTKYVKTSYTFNSSDYNNDGDTTYSSSDLTINNDSTVVFANLDFEVGGGNFSFGDSTSSKLFEIGSNTQLNVGNLEYKYSDDKRTVDIEFKPSDNEDLFKKGFKKKLDFILNTRPIWDLKAEIGAGSFDIDLDKFKVRKFDIDGGAASIKLRLGDKADTSDISVDAGAANVIIYIPRTSACEISGETALSQVSLPGFKQVNDEIFRTENYGKSSKLVNIELNGGMSNFKVIRY